MVVLQPPLISGVGGRRWLEKYQALPVNKRDWQKLHDVALDGVLVCVRAVASNALCAIVAHSEAALVQQLAFRLQCEPLLTRSALFPNGSRKNLSLALCA